MTVMMKHASFVTMPRPHKAALTGFLLLALLHLFVVSAGMALAHSGTTAQSMREHYAGNEEDASVPIENLKSAKSVTEILTITHFHMAVMPIFTFLLCHLLAMAATLGPRPKIAIIVVAYLSIALEMAVPWFGLFAPSLVALRHLSRAGMVVTNLFATLIPMYEMWFWKAKRI